MDRYQKVASEIETFCVVMFLKKNISGNTVSVEIRCTSGVALPPFSRETVLADRAERKRSRAKHCRGVNHKDENRGKLSAGMRKREQVQVPTKHECPGGRRLLPVTRDTARTVL